MSFDPILLNSLFNTLGSVANSEIQQLISSQIIVHKGATFYHRSSEFEFGGDGKGPPKEGREAKVGSLRAGALKLAVAHTDWKQIRGGMHDGRWFLCYEDNALRFVTGYGIFDDATTQNALKALDEAVESHGRPTSVMTDHGSQFYANKKEEKGSFYLIPNNEYFLYGKISEI